MVRRKAVLPKLTPRPLRGSPQETRERIVRAAADIFNAEGYEGTDSNRIAREAGYSPGTFYKHFTDKRQVFLAVYEEWVAREWREVSEAVESEGTAEERAGRIVGLSLEHHRRWRGFRASLRALVSTDVEVRDFYRAQRRRQLELLERMRDAVGGAGSREADALLLHAGARGRRVPGWRVSSAQDSVRCASRSSRGARSGPSEPGLTSGSGRPPPLTAASTAKTLYLQSSTRSDGIRTK